MADVFNIRYFARRFFTKRYFPSGFVEIPLTEPTAGGGRVTFVINKPDVRKPEADDDDFMIFFS